MSGCSCGRPGIACTCGGGARCDFTPGGQLGMEWVELEDAMRDIDATLGFRPYAVWIVRLRWTGERVGVGAEQVAREVEILPVPRVTDVSGIVRQLTPAQVEEAGTIVLTGVSGVYTEDQITLRPPGGGSMAPNEAAFYELRFRDSERRRFVPASAPGFDAERMQWTITLKLYQGHRDRASGAPR